MVYGYDHELMNFMFEHDITPPQANFYVNRGLTNILEEMAYYKNKRVTIPYELKRVVRILIRLKNRLNATDTKLNDYFIKQDGVFYVLYEMI